MTVSLLRVYIAAPYQLKSDAQKLKAELAQHYIGCTSTWLIGKADELETRNDQNARLDLHDVGRADALIAINPKEWACIGTGGRHVELGYALALRKPIFVLGEKTNVFHEHSEVSVVSNELELIAAIWDQMDAT